MACLRESDIVISGVTAPSLEVGYEVGRAAEIELYKYVDYPGAAKFFDGLFKSLKL